MKLFSEVMYLSFFMNFDSVDEYLCMMSLYSQPSLSMIVSS